MRRWPLHPILFAAFPVLFLFAENANLVRPGKIVLPLVVVLTCTAVGSAVAMLVFRDMRRGAIVASGAALVALSYGHVWTAAEGNSIAGLVVGRDLFLLPLFALIGAGVLFFAWRVRALDETTAILNAVAVALAGFALFNAGSAVASQSGRPLQARAGERSEPVPVAKGKGTTRDVYYIVLDRYTSLDVLERFGMDNSPFVGALRKRGFYVADRSVTNYPKTAMSLSSSLNMAYLDSLTKLQGRDSSDWHPLYKLLVGPKVSRFLQNQGYQYAHIGPWYDPTAHDPTAQVNYHYNKQSELTRVLLQTTIVQPLAKRIGMLKELDPRQVSNNQVRFQFDSLLDASKLQGPTFVFSHILVTHEPFTFNADGSYRSEAEERRRTFAENYVDAVKFANKRLLEVIDRLLDVPEAQRPIVILQGDEGAQPFPIDWGNDVPWTEAPDDVLRHKFPIMNAYYFPGEEEPPVYPSITPVNSFRMLFNLYFGTDLKLLKDEAYIFESKDRPYRFKRITDRLPQLSRD